MGLTWIRDRNARQGTSTVLAMAAALTLIAGCATTVAGSAQAVGDGPEVRPAPAAGGPTSSGRMATDRSTPSFAGPGRGTSDAATTDPATTESADPATSDPATSDPDATDPATDQTTTAPTTSKDLGPKGVPDPTDDHLRKKIGEDSGIAYELDGKTTRILTFAVTEIDPDMGKKCDDPSATPKGAALIGVKVRFTVPKSYRADQNGEISFARESFAVKDANGEFYNYTGSPAAKNCLSKGLLPAEPLRAGDSGTGWIVLDSAVRYGLVQFNSSALDGANGWEWVIPGS